MYSIPRCRSLNKTSCCLEIATEGFSICESLEHIKCKSLVRAQPPLKSLLVQSHSPAIKHPGSIVEASNGRIQTYAPFRALTGFLHPSDLSIGYALA